MKQKPLQLDEEHSITLKPRRIGYEPSPGLRIRALSGRSKNGRDRPLAAHLQRCTVKIHYTKGGSAGKWYSHGAYIARESPEGLGFNAQGEQVPAAKTVARWRRNGDDLFFRVIISPENGDRLDLTRLVRETMAQMERDLETRLTWVAVAHHNTGKPHVHVMIRGQRDDGRLLRIPPAYIQQGLQDRAAEAATRQLGYRTREDFIREQQREVRQARFTGLDRRLLQRAQEDGAVSINPQDGLTESFLEQRLSELERMGLAIRSNSRWQIHQELEQSLRSAQKTRDRRQMMKAHGIMPSDATLPFRHLRREEIDSIEGQILVHGQDEYSGNNFSLIETIQGELVRFPQLPEVAEARQTGGLRPGEYCCVQKSGENRWRITVEGDAQALLSNAAFLRANAQRLAKIIPAQYGGWLGHLREAAQVAERKVSDRGR